MAPSRTSGIAFVEIADSGEKQAITHPEGIEIGWLYRGQMATCLADAIMAVDWPTDRNTFGWFASEGRAAAQVRDHWRNTLGFSRDQTLAAAYWKEGQSGVMAG
ncbi:siderophore-interacting protein [Rhizobium panacihumi]|uniref:siderophore-interacting protein n=1 Tax=Rhizobium panacihumi TaxID=2008450 RepID=UPI003D7A2E5B